MWWVRQPQPSEEMCPVEQQPLVQNDELDGAWSDGPDDEWQACSSPSSQSTDTTDPDVSDEDACSYADTRSEFMAAAEEALFAQMHHVGTARKVYSLFEQYGHVIHVDTARGLPQPVRQRALRSLLSTRLSPWERHRIERLLGIYT